MGDGTARLIAQMIARLLPIAFETYRAEQCDADVALRCFRQPDVEGLHRAHEPLRCLGIGDRSSDFQASAV